MHPESTASAVQQQQQEDTSATATPRPLPASSTDHPGGAPKSKKSRGKKDKRAHEVQLQDAHPSQVRSHVAHPSTSTSSGLVEQQQQDGEPSEARRQQQHAAAHSQPSTPTAATTIKREKRKRQKERRAQLKLAERQAEDSKDATHRYTPSSDATHRYTPSSPYMSGQASPVLDATPAEDTITVRLPRPLQASTSSSFHSSAPPLPYVPTEGDAQPSSSPSSSYHPSSIESRPSSRALTVSSHTTSRSDGRVASSSKEEHPFAAAADSANSDFPPSTSTNHARKLKAAAAAAPATSSSSQTASRSIVSYLSKLDRPPYFAFTAPQDMSLHFNEPNSKAYNDFRSKRPILVMRIALHQPARQAEGEKETTKSKKKKKKANGTSKFVEVTVQLTPQHEFVRQWRQQAAQPKWNPKNEALKVRLPRRSPPTAPLDLRDNDNNTPSATPFIDSDASRPTKRPSISRRASAPILVGLSDTRLHENVPSLATKDAHTSDALPSMPDGGTAAAHGPAPPQVNETVGHLTTALGHLDLASSHEDAGPLASTSQGDVSHFDVSQPHNYAQQQYQGDVQHHVPASPWPNSSVSSEVPPSRMGAYNQPFYAPDGSLWILDEYTRAPVPYHSDPGSQNEQYFPLYKAPYEYHGAMSPSYYTQDAYAAPYDPYTSYHTSYDPMPHFQQYHSAPPAFVHPGGYDYYPSSPMGGAPMSEAHSRQGAAPAPAPPAAAAASFYVYPPPAYHGGAAPPMQYNM